MSFLDAITRRSGRTDDESYEAIACSICGSSDAQVLTDRLHGASRGFPAICTQCGLVYLNPRWPQARYDRYNREEYESHRQDPNDHSFAVAADAVWARLDAWLPTDVRSVLDIGAGTGHSLEKARQKFPTAKLHAIEPSAEAAVSLAAREFEVIAADASPGWDVTYRDAIDVITMRHVVEHLVDPVGVLAKVSVALRDDGVAYIAVPNMMRPKGSPHHYWFQVVHTHYFSSRTLGFALQLAGLELAHLDDSGAEIWMILRKGKRTEPAFDAEHVQKQLTVARDYLHHWRWYDRTFRLRSPIRAMMPRWFRGFFGRLVFR